MLLSELTSRANDFRVVADGKLGPLNFSFLQGFRRFGDDSVLDLGVTPGINRTPTVSSLSAFARNEPARGSVNYSRFSLQTLCAERLFITVRIIYSKAKQN